MNGRLVAVLTVTSLVLAGCGSGIAPNQPVFVTQILSDPQYDGDIAKDPASGDYTVTQGSTESVYAGIDPGTYTEYRAFLDFPLSGRDGVPLDAVIVSATLDIVVSDVVSLPLAGPVPLRFDLVSFEQPMIGTDFDRSLQPALASISVAPWISGADIGRHIAVDLTSLMIEAQLSGLPVFQVRILEDLGIVSPGLIEINDATGPDRPLLAPLLEVVYY